MVGSNMRNFFLVLLAVLMSVSTAYGAVTEHDCGRFVVKNLLVKSYYRNQQGELIRWSDNELLKIDTVTGDVWRWVSERTPDKKDLREYWLLMEDNQTPMAEGSR